MSEATRSSTPRPASYLYLRHRWPIRLTHWINVLSLTVLLMSGLMIFNAHRSLDWGKSSYTGRPSFLEISSRVPTSGQAVGITRVFGHKFETTGWLGVSMDADGQVSTPAFPGWITIPSHYSLASRHLQRDLAPTRQDWRGIGRSIRDHLRFRHGGQWFVEPLALDGHGPLPHHFRRRIGHHIGRCIGFTGAGA